MTTQILKTVLAGILAGIAFFLLPFFLLKAFLFFALLGMAFKLMRGNRRRHFRNGMHAAFASKFQNMSEEEQKEFMWNHGYKTCYNYRNFNDKENNPNP